MRTPLLFVLAFAAAACGATPATTETPKTATTAKPVTPPADPEADRAPSPYTAAQIRDASKAGRTILLVMESPDKPPLRKRMRFLAVDDERATIASETLDDAGKPLGPAETETATWDEIRKHASFPKATTTITDAVAEVPAGSFPCKRYTVIEGKKKTVACFANDLPGPPVEMTIEEDGKLLMSMELVKDEPGE
jgi:hypothetical protein